MSMKSLFQKQKKAESETYDSAIYTPVIRASICTGEKVAGFRSQDGKMHEVMLIRSDKDLDTFREQYGISGEIKTIY